MMKTLSALILLSGLLLVSGIETVRAQQNENNDLLIYNVSQRDFSNYKTDLEATVLDRRFVTREAMYLANEMILSGTGFYANAVEAGLPVLEDKDFFSITAIESYWYSRYNLSNLVAKSRMGLHLVHGPYLTLKALEQNDNVFYNRDRGERDLANREILLNQVLPLYLARTGFPRRFEDASPLMLEFASGDPALSRTVDINDDFEGGNGKPDLEDSYLTMRWDPSKMDRTIDLGGVGQTLVKQSLWMEYFFTQNHADGKLLGNDAEEGFRGALLNLMSVSKMLLLKSALFYDTSKLGGINPTEYDPDTRLAYLPHRLGVRLIQPGDIPPRPEWFTVKDNSSQLFDQASLLWGTTEYFYFSDPNVKDNWDSVFGENSPYDGSIMEQKYATGLSSGLADVLLKNIRKQHWNEESGSLVSEWTPKSGTGSSASLKDVSISMVALANYAEHMRYGSGPLRDSAIQMLRDQAEFLIGNVQASDGSFSDRFDVISGDAISDSPSLSAQAFAVRGLMAAYHVLDDSTFLTGAEEAYAYMNDKLWEASLGLYRTGVDAEESVYTPFNVGAVLGAMREMILETKGVTEIERFKRFFVQAVDQSGLMLAEESDTGEHDISLADGDGDGIPQVQFARNGKRGMAAVYASKIIIKTPLSAISKRIE